MLLPDQEIKKHVIWEHARFQWEVVVELKRDKTSENTGTEGKLAQRR